MANKKNIERLKSRIVLFMILSIFWILWNNSLQLDVLISGFILIFIIVLIFGKSSDIFNGIKFTPSGLFYTFLYIYVFVIALLKSNFDVILRVLHPKLPINPGIVRIETSLTSPIARLILANSITLTPGTFVVDIKDKYLYIHWIDVCCSDESLENQHKITQKISGKFEKILKKIYE